MHEIEAQSRMTSQYNRTWVETRELSVTQVYEYADRATRVEQLKRGFTTALGIENPRWDATEVFSPDRFLFPEEDIELFPHTNLFSEPGRSHEHATGNGAIIPEYFSDISGVLTDALRDARHLGVELENDEVQEAVVDLAVKATIRLQRVLGDDGGEVYGRMRQFAVNTLQRMQLEITGGQSREYDVVRKFDREFDRARQAKLPEISSTDANFMQMGDVARWENIVMAMTEEALGVQNYDDFMNVRKALVLARTLHGKENQTHLGLHPYPVHLSRVMVRTLEDPTIKSDRKTLRDTLMLDALHDVLEDTDVSPEELEDMFGTAITDGVVALSKWIKSYGVPAEWDPDIYFGNLKRQPKPVRDAKGYDRVDNCDASDLKVSVEIEERTDAIRAQEAYYLETGRYFPDLTADNPILTEKLHQRVSRPRKNVLELIA